MQKQLYTIRAQNERKFGCSLETNLQFAEIAVSDCMRHDFAPQGTNGCRENSTEGIATAENGPCK
jgi:hypothetical protein